MNYPKDSLEGAKAKRSNPKAGISPVLILCDNSGSMSNYVETVNNCITDIIKDLQNDPVRSNKIDLRIVSFNTEYLEILPFTIVSAIQLSDLKKVEKAEWATFLGTALSKAVKELSDEKALLKEAKVTYTQPNLIVISDGYPEKEDPEVTASGIKAVQDKISKERWNCIPIFLGYNHDSNIMNDIAVPDLNGNNKEAITFSSRDKKNDIIKAFQFASMSISVVNEQPGTSEYSQTPTAELQKKVIAAEERLKAIKRNPSSQKKKSFLDKLHF